MTYPLAVVLFIAGAVILLGGIALGLCRAAQDAKWEKASWEAERELRAEALAVRAAEFDVAPVADSGLVGEIERYLEWRPGATR